jgi:hypothetical protein
MNKWIVFIGLISGIFNVSAQCDHTQLYPADTVTPIMDWMMLDSCSKAGQYALIHVEEGMYYGFSTRAADGSDITYDSQLTLRKSNGDLIAYNDDAEANNLQSIIYWTANFTGQVELHLSEYDCQVNDTCGKIMIYMSEGAGLSEEIVESKPLVYPNPSNGNFTIKLSDSELQNTREIVISNLLGQVVFRSSSLATITPIVLNEVNGFYFVEIYSLNNQIIRSEKLIIQ